MHIPHGVFEGTICLSCDWLLIQSHWAMEQTLDAETQCCGAQTQFKVHSKLTYPAVQVSPCQRVYAPICDRFAGIRTHYLQIMTPVNWSLDQLPHNISRFLSQSNILPRLPSKEPTRSFHLVLYKCLLQVNKCPVLFIVFKSHLNLFSFC